MKFPILKLTRRSIRSFCGRYIALLLIIMLSVGFFAGLKVTKDAMANTCENYLYDRNFYDFRIFSDMVFSEDDVESFSEMTGIADAEGGKTADVMLEHEGNASPFKLLSLPEKTNLPSLVAGRMPQTERECLADTKAFGEEDIGKIVRLTEENDEDVISRFSETEFTIVGLADSPLYLNADRGTAGIGSGALEGFLYLPPAAFTGDIYTEINVTLKETAEIYSDEYEELVDSYRTDITQTAERLADDRYQKLIAENGLTPEIAVQNGMSEAEVYVLTRAENAGYVGFENDTSIVSGIANIFPVFFILIAMLVCITTMSRMVDEERTQIGVLKAMGFGNRAITLKYLMYAGSATLFGWTAGFFLGTWGIPEIFWLAYSSLYDFAPLDYLFSPELALLTLIAAMAAILGSTWLSCRKELGSEPAKLIRPRTVKSGKRILLERITPLWNRLPFLQKITLRNMFRYKRRLIMMLVGISCCAGLVVTAFGVRDSMIHIGTMQFEEIQTYDMEAAFVGSMEEDVRTELEKTDEIEAFIPCSVLRVDLHGSSNMNSVNLYSFEKSEQIYDFWNLRAGDLPVLFPENGEAIVGGRVAEKLKLSVGDSLKIQNADRETMTVTVSGIFDNYIDNFIMVSKETQEEGFRSWCANTMLLSVSQDTQKTAEKLTSLAGITGVTKLSATKESIDSALSCLNYIIWLIVLFSGALAFIVIFNLTNINLTERSREIATVEVLGFYPKETESYTLRENLVLSVLAGFIGLPLGTLFHQIVMRLIVIDNMAFDIHVTAASYRLSLLCTIMFAVAVNLFMKRQIGKIQMAESLKAVE